MISSESRYANSALITITKNGKDVQVITPGEQTSYTFSYVYHILNGSDRVDTLSNAFYTDPTKWWKIADANPEIMNWLDLVPGIVIRIPNS